MRGRPWIDCPGADKPFPEASMARRMPEPFQGFEIGKRYRLHEEMWPASRAFGSYLGGIALAGRYPGTTGIAVLARLGERTRYGTPPRYGNRLDGDVLVFSGEDRRGFANARQVDQDPYSGANRALTESSDKGTPVYCFCAREADENWEYLGLGEVESWELVPHRGRLVVQYRLGLEGSPSVARSVVQRRQAEDEVVSASPPELTEPAGRNKVPTARKTRSRAFSQVVKRIYGNSCAVCGSKRVDARGRPEAQAAHIYPVEKNGKDDVRNGLALCRLHHWAFDGALLGVDAALVVRVLEAGRGVVGVSDFDGKPLVVLPAETERRPHELYLEARFRLSERGWTRGSEGERA